MIDRSNYPRVTSILEIVAKDGLQIWAVKEAMKKLLSLYQEHMGTHGTADLAALCQEANGASDEIKRNAARRGTAVHHLIEGRKREELSIAEGDWENIENMYKSFELWASERNFEPIANEVPIWSDKHGFKGTLDCIGYVDGRLELIDWKTSNAIDLSYRMQTSAYWYGLRESWPMPVIGQENVPYNPFTLQGIRIVRFGGRSDKETQVKDLVKYEELIIDGDTEIAEDFNAFLAAKRLYDWKLKRK